MNPVELVVVGIGAGLGYGLALALVNTIALRLRMRAASKYNRLVAEAALERAEHHQAASAPAPVVEPERGPYL